MGSTAAVVKDGPMALLSLGDTDGPVQCEHGRPAHICTQPAYFIRISQAELDDIKTDPTRRRVYANQWGLDVSYMTPLHYVLVNSLGVALCGDHLKEVLTDA